MTPRPVSPPPPDHGALWVALVCFLAAVAAAVALCTQGCATAPPVRCPLGTFPRRALVTIESKGGVDAKAAIPDKAVTAGGTWSGAGSSQYECARTCPSGTALKMEESRERKAVECVDLDPRGAVKP